MALGKQAGGARSGLANILKNLAWLVGGKGFGAICSIVYLAILVRSLGVRDFGNFSLIFATGQALVAIASFRTWQIIVKFGAVLLHRGQWEKFGQLAWLGAKIDVAGAAVGTLIAAIIYYGFAPLLEIEPDYVDMAFAFNVALLWGRMTTPNGILRVIDRFDLAIYVEAIVPIGRLLASLVIILTGASVAKFLFAWALFDLLSGLVYWIVAFRSMPQALNMRTFGTWRSALADNEGLGGFFFVTYFTSTLDAIYKQGPLLAVGYLLGTSAAGLYRLADQLAQGIGKLSQLVARAIFPEFAMAHVASSARDFSRLVGKVAGMATIAGVFVTMVALLLGEHVLVLVGGDQVVQAAAILVPIAIGASFDIAAVSCEPVLYSTGHPTYPLIARLVSTGILAAGIYAWYGYGPVGVGWAVALGLSVFYATMTLTVWLVLRGMRRSENAD